MEMWQLQQRQNYPLDLKVAMSLRRIKLWLEHWEDKAYVAFSGGKDSTVLLHLARQIYPNIPAVFSDTGLEYPEIRNFVKETQNVVWVKPKLTFKEVIEKYGYPVISKEQAQYISEARSTKSEKLRNTRLNGNKSGRGKISEKWKFLLDAPFKIDDRCCDVLKKGPSAKYEKETGNKAIVGVMAEEGSKRVQDFLKYGCNAFETKRPMSRPIGFWTEKDIWEYLKQNQIQYSSIYDMGYERTGCMFCMFGVHLEDEPNRFQRMKLSHPAQHNYCMEKLGLAKILDFIKVPY